MSFFNMKSILLNKNDSSTSLSHQDKMNESTLSYNIDDISTREHEWDYDYNADAYSFLKGYNEAFYNANKEFYKNILESCDSEVVITESFSDFFDKCREVIKKFLEWIKRIFAKFITKITSLFKSEKYLIKHKKKFSQFSTEHEFKFEGYKFTNLYDGYDIPKCDPQSMIAAGEENMFAAISGSTALDYDKIVGAYEKWIDNSEDWYDHFRGQVLGLDEDIPSSSFEEEVFIRFRDGSKEKSTIDVTSTEVSEAYTRFEGYDKLKKSVEKTKNSVENAYKALERYLDKAYKFKKDSFEIKSYSGSGSSGTSSAYVSGELSSFGLDPNSTKEYKEDDINNTFSSTSGKDLTTAESKKNIKTAIEQLFRAKYNQVQQMSNIHTLAFSGKLTAAKDCLNQDKALLYKALAKIQGKKSEYDN